MDEEVITFNGGKEYRYVGRLPCGTLDSYSVYKSAEGKLYKLAYSGKIQKLIPLWPSEVKGVLK